jgi:hypothetical protein
MKPIRCPYHVKQGHVDSKGNLILSHICGIKSAGGQNCSFAPFPDTSFKECPRYIVQTKNLSKQVVVPKEDIEYFPNSGESDSFQDLEII